MEKPFFTRKNLFGLIAGTVVIILGFILLGQGPAENPVSLSVAPVLLTVAYFIIIPWAILAKEGSDIETHVPVEEDKGV